MKLLLLGIFIGWYLTIGFGYFTDLRKSKSFTESVLLALAWGLVILWEATCKLLRI